MPSLGRDLLLATDRIEFARACGIEPDGWQADLLQSTHPRILVNVGRQCGKTTTCGLIGLHTALYEDASLVLIVSPSLRQSQEIFRSVLTMFRKLDGAPDPSAESALRLELRNGSRIVSLPGSEHTVRGYAGARLLLIDEASRVEDSLMGAVRPMLATTGGRLIAPSTPWGKRGWWHGAWRDGAEQWKRILVRASECPRISPAFLEEERRELGEWLFRQEYECAFVEQEEAVFTSEMIANMLSPDVTPLWREAA